MKDRARQSESKPTHPAPPAGHGILDSMILRWGFWTLLTGVIAGACDSNAPSSPTPPLTSLTMQPDSARVAVAASVDFDVVIQDRRGDSMDARWTWSVEDSTVATVNRIGVAVGTSAGETTIRADRVIGGDEKSVGASIRVVEGGGP